MPENEIKLKVAEAIQESLFVSKADKPLSKAQSFKRLAKEWDIRYASPTNFNGKVNIYAGE